MEASLTVQRMVADQLERLYETFNVPTHDDLVALGVRMKGIEDSLARIEGAMAAPPRAPRQAKGLDACTAAADEATHGEPERRIDVAASSETQLSRHPQNGRHPTSMQRASVAYSSSTTDDLIITRDSPSRRLREAQR